MPPERIRQTQTPLRRALPLASCPISGQHEIPTKPGVIHPACQPAEHRTRRNQVLGGLPAIARSLRSDLAIPGSRTYRLDRAFESDKALCCPAKTGAAATVLFQAHARCVQALLNALERHEPGHRSGTAMRAQTTTAVTSDRIGRESIGAIGSSPPIPTVLPAQV